MLLNIFYKLVLKILVRRIEDFMDGWVCKE